MENAEYFSIKNFDQYQHYKTRNPPWVKLHYSILDDELFISLDPTSRCYLMTLFLVASKKNNRILNDPQYLKKVMRLDDSPNLTPLFERGFLQASRKQRLAANKHSAPKQRSESEADNSEAEAYKKRDASFDLFWTKYPRKVGKDQAEKAWKKANPQNGMVEKILLAVEVQKGWPSWQKDGGQFIPHPSTWLNQKRWEDEGVVTEKPKPKLVL